MRDKANIFESSNFKSSKLRFNSTKCSANDEEDLNFEDYTFKLIPHLLNSISVLCS